MPSIDELLKASGLTAHGRNSSSGPGRVFLHAGQVFTSAEPVEISTILGSCVAICMWDPGSGVGGMNHFMLPTDVGANVDTPRYARFATSLLLEELQQAGAQRPRLRAKIFGGAHILGAASNEAHDLGLRNVRAARERLGREAIPIVDERTGGVDGLKVIFHTGTGNTTLAQVSRVVE